jgi:hypothetical protein
MIVFFESGRLGNQLFQYAALRTLAADERLVLVGFDDLRATFANLDATFPVSSTSLPGRLLMRLRPRLDRIAQNQPVIGRIGEDVDHGRCDVRIDRGWLRALRYGVTAYFQSESVFDPAVVDRLEFHRDLECKARDKLRGLGPQDRKRIFVHVRRGDYESFPSAASPAVLPAQWYRDCIQRVRARVSDPVLVFCSDDPEYVSNMFGDVPGMILSNGSAFEDFVLMSLCDGGIVSASSYSWWAAYRGSRTHPDRVFLAPQYWIGHSTAEWFPPGVDASFMEYVTVDRQVR